MPLEPGQNQLEHDLSELLRDWGCDDERLIVGVASLEGVYGERVYKEALRLLVGKTFGSDLSRQYWLASLDHRNQLFRPEYLGSALRPALLDYLHRIAGELEDPRIIDAAFLNNITRSSVTDGLTGLYNQTYFKQTLIKVLGNKRRGTDTGFAVLLFDLDHFKQYNDRCGHLCGDEALRRTAEIIRNSLRDGDIAARYGGEEFAVYLPLVDRETAIAVAERIRLSVETELFSKQELLDRGTLTISGGVSVYPDDGRSMTALIEAADRELYRAKSYRNTICPMKSDRRRNSRRAVRSLVEYASFDGALYRPALSQDISETGMGLGCETLIEPGTVLSLRLTRPYWPESMVLSATVRQIRRQGELVYVGLEFERNLAEIERMLAGCRPAVGIGSTVAPLGQGLTQ